jgi:phage terminase small subunit
MIKAEAIMGTKWKPVQPTEIKDINIIREVIAQIRKPIPQEVYDRLAEEDRVLEKGIMQIDPEELSRKWAAIRRERAEKGNAP